tara:strand:- start:9 stop:272 length:264 start_codon:yes stop_codon:yes gene_type:complete
MSKVLNILLLILIIIFSLTVFKYYSSTVHFESRNFNRDNIDKIIQDKIVDLPILDNNTNDVILFNDSFSNESKNDKIRSFWDLLKSK